MSYQPQGYQPQGVSRPSNYAAPTSSTVQRPSGTASGRQLSEQELRMNFDSYDRNRDGTIAIEEARQIYAKYGLNQASADYLFRKYDADRNGVLNYDEFRNLMNAGSSTSSQPAYTGGDRVVSSGRPVSNTYNPSTTTYAPSTTTNVRPSSTYAGDRYVSSTPGQAGQTYTSSSVGAGRQLSDQELRMNFDSYDRNRDGSITIEEARQIYAKYGLNQASADYLFRKYDADRNGTLSFEEFRNLMNAGSTTTTTSTVNPVVTHSTLGTDRVVSSGRGSIPPGSRPTGRVSTRELDTKVSTVVGDRRFIGRETRQSVVKGYNYGESRVIGENRREGGIINVTENRLQEIVRQSTRPEVRTHTNYIDIEEEEAVVVERIVEKPVEVIIQRKIPRERIVEVPYDVIVERPIEKVYHKDVIIERIVEKQKTKIVEVPVEVIYEIPVEKIIERHIEYETIVEVPVERIVERRVEEIIENVRYQDRVQEIDIRDVDRYRGQEILPKQVRTTTQERVVERPVYVDNVIEQVVQVPVERIVEHVVDKVVEVPIERVVERPVYVDNIIHKQIDVPRENIIDRPVEQIIEVPVYVDNVIERPVPIERIVERKIDIPVERIVDVPVYVDNIIHKQVEIVREVEKPYTETVERDVEEGRASTVQINEYSERPYERVYERPVKVGGSQTVPIDYIIEKSVFVPRENVFEINVPQINARRVDRDIVKLVNIERVVERPVAVERPVEVVLKRYIEVPRFVEQVEEREVPIEAKIERVIERLVERKIEVPVEKIIEVPVHVHTERGRVNEIVTEELVDREATVLQAVQGGNKEEVVEVGDLLCRSKTHPSKLRSGDIKAKLKDSFLRHKDTHQKSEV